MVFDQRSDHRLLRVLVVQLNPTVGDLAGNAAKILQGIQESKDHSAQIALLPELCLTRHRCSCGRAVGATSPSRQGWVR